MAGTAPDGIDKLRPSGALLAANIAIGEVIERDAVSQTPYDTTTLDLLIRLGESANGRLRAVELCEQTMKSPSHVSRMLDRAEDEGLVERRPDPEDRRASQVLLTPKGTAVVTDFLPSLVSVLEDVIYTPLSADEVETLVDLMDRIEAAARSRVCPTAPAIAELESPL